MQEDLGQSWVHNGFVFIYQKRAWSEQECRDLVVWNKELYTSEEPGWRERNAKIINFHRPLSNMRGTSVFKDENE